MIATITTGQFQELYKINKSEMDDLDKHTEMVAVITGKTSREVEAMPMTEFNKLDQEATAILSAPLPAIEPKKILAGYGICYEPGKLPRGNYVTFLHFMNGDVFENCHLLLASLAYNPQTKAFDDDHQKIADAMQEVPMVDVYGSCLFFCQLFNNSIRALQSYLLKAMMMSGMKKEESLKTLENLQSVLDGYLTLNKSQTLKESVYGSPMIKTQ